MSVDIRHARSGSGAVCQSILAGLPEWFGIPASNAAYARLAEEGPAWTASADGEPQGIMVLKAHFATTIEIELLAVRRDRHRSGVGRALVAAAESHARAHGARFLTVKTRGPSLPYEPYERTRTFYEAVGFTALEEFIEIWGPENPALLMAMAL